MIPYLLLVFIPAFCCYLTLDRKKNTLKIGNNSIIEKTNIGLPVFFICLFLLLALRNETLGRDLSGYKYIFKQYIKIDFSTIFADYLKLDGQVLWVLLNKIVGQFTDSFHIFLIVVAAITVLPQAYVLNKYRDNSFLQIILYVSVSFLSMFFSGIRQGISMAIGVLAYEYCRNNKLIPYLICCIIALGFHHSAFVLFFMYPVYHAKWDKKTLFFITPIFVGIFIFNKQVFVILSDFFSDFSDKYAKEITSTNAYGSLMLFLLFAVFSIYITTDLKDYDSETAGIRNILILTVLLQFFAPINPIAMRMNYYYMVLIPRGVSMCVNSADEDKKNVAYIGKIVIITFFIFYYVRKTVVSSITGIGDLDIYPYVPFWR